VHDADWTSLFRLDQPRWQLPKRAVAGFGGQWRVRGVAERKRRAHGAAQEYAPDALVIREMRSDHHRVDGIAIDCVIQKWRAPAAIRINHAIAPTNQPQKSGVMRR
jgi:hypothetical protein